MLGSEITLTKLKCVRGAFKSILEGGENLTSQKSDTRLRILAVEKMLCTSEYPLKISEIIERLKDDFNISVSKKQAIHQDIAALREYYSINYNRKTGYWIEKL